MKVEKIKMSSEKNFGLVFFVVFLILGYYFYDKNIFLSAGSFFISLFFVISAVFFRKILIKPNIIWFKFGIFISKITSPIIMFFLYFGVITPTGIIYFFKKQKQYKNKLSKNKKSYWIIREKVPQSMDNQY